MTKIKCEISLTLTTYVYLCSGNTNIQWTAELRQFQNQSEWEMYVFD